MAKMSTSDLKAMLASEKADALAALSAARLAEEREQVRRLARGAHQREARVSMKSFMEDVNSEQRGRNDVNRRLRNRGKRIGNFLLNEFRHRF